MIKVGDTLIAKPEFLLRHQIPYEKRFFKIEEINDVTVTLSDGDKNVYSIWIESILNNFYLPDCINHEIANLINDKNIRFKSFQGVTVDGKVIQIELP
jgi:hypothetical protein